MGVHGMHLEGLIRQGAASNAGRLAPLAGCCSRNAARRRAFNFNTFPLMETELEESKLSLEAITEAITDCSGGSYVGQVRDGQKHGQGEYKAADGSHYLGEFREDKAHGQGICYFPDGDVCEGAWEDDDQHGFGVWRSFDGSIYEGTRERGLREGVGRQTWVTDESGRGRACFVGVWAGCEEIRGTLTFVDGSSYEGEMRGRLTATGIPVFLGPV